MNSWLQGVPTRYSYNILMKQPRARRAVRRPRQVRHTDGRFTAYSAGDHFWYSEAPFAPADAQAAEDDGYLVSFVTDMQRETTEIQVFDARGTNLGDGPVARIALPRRVPHGFHATWVSAKRLAAAPRPAPHERKCCSTSACARRVARASPAAHCRRAGRDAARWSAAANSCTCRTRHSARRRRDHRLRHPGRRAGRQRRQDRRARGRLERLGLGRHRQPLLRLEPVGVLHLAAARVTCGDELVVAGGVESMSRVPMASDQPPFIVDPATVQRLGAPPMGVSADGIATLQASVARTPRPTPCSRSSAPHVPARRATSRVAGARARRRRARVARARRNDPARRLGREAAGHGAVLCRDGRAMGGRAAAHAAPRARSGRTTTTTPATPRRWRTAPRSRCSAASLPHAASTSATCASAGHRQPRRRPRPGPQRRARRDSQGPANGRDSRVADIDLFEVNEAFAAPTLHFMRQLGIDPDRFNVNGGAIALGHAMGATGTTLVGMLADELARRGATARCRRRERRAGPRRRGRDRNRGRLSWRADPGVIAYHDRDRRAPVRTAPRPAGAGHGSLCLARVLQPVSRRRRIAIRTRPQRSPAVSMISAPSSAGRSNCSNRENTGAWAPRCRRTPARHSASTTRAPTSTCCSAPRVPPCPAGLTPGRRHASACASRSCRRWFAELPALVHAVMHTAGQSPAMSYAGSGTNALDRGIEAIVYAHQAMSAVRAAGAVGAALRLGHDPAAASATGSCRGASPCVSPARPSPPGTPIRRCWRASPPATQ